VAVAALVGLCTLLAALTWRTWGDLGVDVGYDLLAATRFERGELPYVDFVYYYGPLGIGSLTVMASVVGNVVTAAVFLGVVLATLIVLMTYAVARTQTDPLGAALAAGITAPLAFAPNNFSYVLPHSFSASWAILAALCFIFALGRYASAGRERWLLAAGTALGVVTLTRPEFVLATCVAAALWLALRAIRWKGALREVVLLVTPAVAVLVAGYGPFAAQMPLRRLLFDNLYPVDALEGSGNVLLRAYAPFTFSSFVHLGAKAVLYAIGAALIVVVARLLARPGDTRRLLVVAVAAVGVVLVALSLARPETLRYYLEYVYAWIPLGAAVAVLVLLWRYRRSSTWSAADQVALAGATILLVLGVKTYNAFLFHAPEPQLAVYAGPFAAIFLARLHLDVLVRSSTRAAYVLGAVWLAFLALAGTGLTLKDGSAKNAKVAGRGGWLYDDASDARVFQEALGWIERETRPGDFILVGPQLQALYVLSGRRDPLPQLSLLPGALGDPEGEMEAADALARNNVRLIIIDEREFPEFGHTSFGRSFSMVLASRIAQRYRRVAVLRASGERPRMLSVWLRTA
jgi:hypothetical protein